jgi:hypothetical protein
MEERRAIGPGLGASLFLLAACLTGCASKPAAIEPPLQYQRVGWVSLFTQDDWQSVLTKTVTPGGYVRWERLSNTPELRAALYRYVSLINSISPDNRPDLFQTRADREAYWLNAYNATCMYGVLQHSLNNPPALYSADHFSFGGVPLTLDQVEDGKIKPLGDPRVAFAINRCTRSSPPLRNEPYDSMKLNTQLTNQGRVFLSDSRGVVVDENGTAKINRILAVDYAPMFFAAYPQKLGKATTIQRALEPYAIKHSALWEADVVTAMPYDSRLNLP